jgi:4-amino-4-deoxy-L-arabinose transferase-like glycosyltransferase
MTFKISRKLLILMNLIGIYLSFSLPFLFKEGFFSDPALYASLSLKISQGMSPWDLNSAFYFKPFYEHPPFFFIWGAWVFKVLGVSEFTARLIGFIPGSIAVFSLLGWLCFRHQKYLTSYLALFLVLVFGHFTKYIFSPWIESALALGTVWVFIGGWELFFSRASSQSKKLRYFLILSLGAFVSVASKGIAGLGTILGLGLSIAIFQFARKSFRIKDYIRWFFVFIVGISPFFLWWFMSSHNQPESGPELYFRNQVLKSFTTNRGESQIHSASGNVFYYVGILFKNCAPWFLLSIWPLITRLWERQFFSGKTEESNSLVFFYGIFSCAFIVPFSLSTFQLPHYIHPIYLPMVAIAALVLSEFLKNRGFFKSLRNPSGFFLKTSFVLSLSFFVLLVFILNKNPKNPSRGYGFRSFARHLSQNNSKEKWMIQLDPQNKTLSQYDIDAFGSWYLRDYIWTYSPEVHFEKISHSVQIGDVEYTILSD